MAQSKSERLMNLVICLLVARTYVSKHRIREVVAGYGDQSVEAFERMFERDKDELRALGVPVETGHVDPVFDDELGYRIRRSEYELPAITLEADEAAVVGLAARVWQQANLAEATSNALLTLQAAGVDTDLGALARVVPRVRPEEPAFWPLWKAAQERQGVTFDYRVPQAARGSERHVQPWGVLAWRGRWYMVGFDRDRDAPRIYRLSRVLGEVRRAGPKAAYAVPPADEVRAAAITLVPAGVADEAVLRIRRGAGAGLRRRASRLEPAGPSAPAGADVVRVPFSDGSALVEELAGYGPDVVLLAPDRLVQRLREHLLDVVAGAS